MVDFFQRWSTVDQYIKVICILMMIDEILYDNKLTDIFVFVTMTMNQCKFDKNREKYIEFFKNSTHQTNINQIMFRS